MNMPELFDGLKRAYGTYTVMEKDGQKLSGKAKTVQQPLTEEIWQLHLTGERSLGVIPIRDDNTVAFAAIDIDRYPLDHVELEKRIEELGLPLVVCRSKSGGAHLYLFIKPPGTLAQTARQRMAEWAAELGFAGVEIFPKQDELKSKEDVGNWINMPYFGGDDDTLRYAIVGGKPVSIELFLKHAKKKAISHDRLDEFSVKGPESELLDGGPPCLQTLLRTGFPKGSRNISLFNLGVLCRKKFDDDWQDKIDEANAELIDPPLSPGEVAQIKRNLEKKTYFYKCNDSPINAVCQKSICSKRPYGIGTEALNDLDTVNVEGSIRIMTEDIYYITTINGKRVYLDHNALCAQHSFRVSVMRQTGFLVPPMKPRQFNLLMNKITTEAQEVEAPKYTGRRGQLVHEVMHIASESNTADNWAQCMSGLPLPDDKGGVYLHPHQLVKLLKRRLSLRTLEPQVLFEALNAEGIKVKEKKVGGRIFWYITDMKKLQTIDEPEEL